MIAVPQQDQIEVYLHADGDVAIRQTDGFEATDVVLIAPENVERVIRALRIAKGEAFKERLRAVEGGL